MKPPGGSAVDDFFKAVMHVSGSCKGMLLLAGGFIFFLVYATSLVSFLTDEETHVKIANYSKSFKFCYMYLYPFLSKFSTFFSEIFYRYFIFIFLLLLILFFNFPLDW